MKPPESAYWLALLQAKDLRRAAAKKILHRWCIIDGRQASALAEARPEELALEFDAAWLEPLGRALASVQEQATLIRNLEAQGIYLLTRCDVAYPEGLPQRILEERLPYIVYYRGNLELLCQAAIAITGTSRPSAEALDFAHSLAGSLASADCVLLSGYQKGLERAASAAAIAAGGNAIAVLPLGLCANAKLHTELTAQLESGHLLVLSPVACDTPYSDALASARLLLTVAMSDLVLAVEPEVAPVACLEALQPPLPSVALWQASNTPASAAWREHGAALVRDSEQVLELWQNACDGTACCAKQAEVESLAYDDTPVAFHDAESAIATLSQSGTVPEVLARRLREHAPEWGN